MNTQDKARIFGMYWGSKFDLINGYHHVLTVESIETCDDGEIRVNGFHIDNCQLILKPISKVTPQEKLQLCGIIPMEKEDLDVLCGGTFHLSTKDNMVNLIFWLISHGYALSDEWFENGIAIKEAT